MPVPITVKVEGLRQLENNLLQISRQYGPKYAVQALRPALRKALAPMKAAIEANTPVDTGALRDSIRIRIGKPKSRQLSNGTFPPNTVVQASVGWFWKEVSLWNASLAVEYGTLFVPGRAVLRRALEDNHREALNIFTRELTKSIDKKATQLYKRGR